MLFALKGIVHQKKWKYTHLQAIRDEFVSSSEQIWRNLEWHHLLTNGSSAVNGCRQNKSPNTDKNITTSDSHESSPLFNLSWSVNVRL